MVLGRRLLRVAALGAVFALALAGTALAAEKKWTGGDNNKNWTSGGNWDPTGVPGAGDTAIFTKSAKITVLGTPSKVKELKFAGSGNVTLTVDAVSNEYLEVERIKVANNTQAKIDSGNQIIVSDGSNSPIEVVGSGATLTIASTALFEGVGSLKLSGGGTLDSKVPVIMVTGLEITGGSTLIVNAADALPNLTGTALSITNGNLTLNQLLNAAITTITVTNGVLTVADAGRIGNGNDSNPDGTVELGDKGRLVLDKPLTLKELKTADGSKIDTNGQTLAVKSLAPSDTLNAEVTGNLKLEPATTGDYTASLKKKVAGKVEVVAAGDKRATLQISDDVSEVAFTSDGTAKKAILNLLGGNVNVGTLSFEKAKECEASIPSSINRLKYAPTGGTSDLLGSSLAGVGGL